MRTAISQTGSRIGGSSRTTVSFNRGRGSRGGGSGANGGGGGKTP